MQNKDNRAPVERRVMLSADRRAQNMQAVDWQNRDLLAEIKWLRDEITQLNQETLFEKDLSPICTDIIVFGA
jgi:hypothetical protein